MQASASCWWHAFFTLITNIYAWLDSWTEKSSLYTLYIIVAQSLDETFLVNVMNDWHDNCCLNSIFTMIYLWEYFNHTVKNDEQVNVFLRNFSCRRLFREWRRWGLRCRSWAIDRQETVVRLLSTRWLTCRWSWVSQTSIVRSRWARWRKRVNLNCDRWFCLWWLTECRREPNVIIRFTRDDCCRCSFWNSIEFRTRRLFDTVDRRLCARIDARWVSWYIDLDVNSLQCFTRTTEKRHVSLFDTSSDYSHCNDAQHQRREKLCSFHVRDAVRRRIEKQHVLYWSLNFRVYSELSGVHYECSFKKHILNREAVRIDYVDNSVKTDAHSTSRLLHSCHYL